MLRFDGDSERYSASRHDWRLASRQSWKFGTGHPKRRRGIGLLEVLISMGVLLLGLLGVAALFPVGQHHVAGAARFDRGAALGQVALNDVKIRGLLRPDLWVDRLGQPAQATATATISGGQVSNVRLMNPGRGYRFPPRVLFRSGSGGGATAIGRTANGDQLSGVQLQNSGQNYLTAPQVQIVANRGLAIDPLGIAANPGDPAMDWFPYGSGAAGGGLARVSLLDASAGPLVRDVAEQIFTSHDDLSFLLPEDRDQPSRQLIQQVEVGSPPTATFLRRQYQGNYSWMLTVVPVIDELSGLYHVTAIVFHKRVLGNFALEERMVQAEFLGGGEVALTPLSGAVEDLADIRPGDWLMLSGQLQIPVPGVPLQVHKWYRVVAVDEQQDPVQTRRYVTLTGPDWNVDRIKPDTVRASLLQSVVAVHERTMPLDGSSIFSSQ